MSLDIIDFYNANFHRSNLRGVAAHFTVFATSDMSEVNFEGGIFRDSNLDQATLVGASFKNAKLEGATFRSANLANANFHGARLNDRLTPSGHEGAMVPDGANFSHANLEGADLRDVDLTGSIVVGTILRAGQLSEPRKPGSQRHKREASQAPHKSKP